MSAVPDPTAPLTATGNLRRRQLVSRFVDVSATGSAVLAVAVLAIVVLTVVSKGASAISFGFLTKDPQLTGGGIAPYLVGTAIIVAGATLIAMPVGVLCALYVTEFAGSRSAEAMRTVLDTMMGLPSVILGIFIFGLIVEATGQSGFAGSVGLSILMLPLIARSTQEVLLLVPKSLREASDALGVSRWRSVIGVTLPAAAGGIVTATLLAAGRAAGDTAILLFVSSLFGTTPGATLNFFGVPVPNVPVEIYELVEYPSPGSIARAWGLALVLLALILVGNVAARVLLARSRARMQP